eukprot:COSAG01_NODE_39089_length_481_cov_0.861257_1_plen_49_part_01
MCSWLLSAPQRWTIHNVCPVSGVVVKVPAAQEPVHWELVEPPVPYRPAA